MQASPANAQQNTAEKEWNWPIVTLFGVTKWAVSTQAFRLLTIVQPRFGCQHTPVKCE